MNAAATLLAISRILSGAPDLIEALRQTCRELASFTGAETVSVHLLDPEGLMLVPAAGYHIPKHAVDILASTPLVVAEQGFSESVFRAGEVVWSDDVQHDPRFAYTLFRRFPHRSGVVIPLLLEGQVAGAFYLVWWEVARRLEADEAETLHGIGQQVALLLRSARLLRESEERRRAAEAAEASYRLLFDRNLAGVWRVASDGRLIQCNDAFARLLGYRSPSEVVARNVGEFYVDPADRERVLARLDEDGKVTNYEVRWQRANRQPFWVLLNATQLPESGAACLEGIVVDVTDHRRAAEIEREAAALRSVARLANAASHEINNPLVVVMGRLEPLSGKLAGDAAAIAGIEKALAACRRIGEMIAHMGRIASLEEVEGTAGLPPILDLERSARKSASTDNG